MLLRNNELFITVLDIISKLDKDDKVFIEYFWYESRKGYHSKTNSDDWRPATRTRRKKLYNIDELIHSDAVRSVENWEEGLIVNYMTYNNDLQGLLINVEPLEPLVDILKNDLYEEVL